MAKRLRATDLTTPVTSTPDPQAVSTAHAKAFEIFPQFARDNYELHQWRHACAILATDFPR